MKELANEPQIKLFDRSQITSRSHGEATEKILLEEIKDHWELVV